MGTKIIKEFTGHLSNAVEGYQHIDDNICRHASAIIQGRSGKVVSATISKPPVDESCEKDSKVAASVLSKGDIEPIDCTAVHDDDGDFQAKQMEMCTPLKRKVQMKDKNCRSKVFEEIEPQNICDLISKMSEKKKYKKIKINVEFIESD